MKKKTLITLLTLGVLLSSGSLSTSTILADDLTSPHKTLVSRIAEKFNLREDEVQAVFDAVRDEKIEQMRQTKQERLSQAVADGVITEAQKQALLSKLGNNKKVYAVKRGEMKSWLQEQGIDSDKLKPYLGNIKDKRFK